MAPSPGARGTHPGQSCGDPWAPRGSSAQPLPRRLWRPKGVAGYPARAVSERQGCAEMGGWPRLGRGLGGASGAGPAGAWGGTCWRPAGGGGQAGSGSWHHRSPLGCSRGSFRGPRTSRFTAAGAGGSVLASPPSTCSAWGLRGPIGRVSRPGPGVGGAQASGPPPSRPQHSAPSSQPVLAAAGSQAQQRGN